MDRSFVITYCFFFPLFFCSATARMPISLFRSTFKLSCLKCCVRNFEARCGFFPFLLLNRHRHRLCMRSRKSLCVRCRVFLTHQFDKDALVEFHAFGIVFGDLNAIIWHTFLTCLNQINHFLDDGIDCRQTCSIIMFIFKWYTIN